MLQVDLGSDRPSWGILAGHLSATRPVDRVAGVEIAQNTIPTPGLDGAENAPPTTAHKAFLFITEEARKRNDYDYNNALHSRRLIDNTDVPASLRSDHDGLE